MSHQIIEDLNWRYACKKFDSSKKLTKDQVGILLDALRLTASSYGTQPWTFLLVKNHDLREKLVEAAYNQKQVVDASHLIILCRPADINEELMDRYIDSICKVRNQKKEELEGFRKMLVKVTEKPELDKVAWAKNQIYIALGTLLTTCATMKIDSCPMEGFVPSKVDEILGLEKMGLKSVLLCPVGYRAADDKYIHIKKVRYTQEEIVSFID